VSQQATLAGLNAAVAGARTQLAGLEERAAAKRGELEALAAAAGSAAAQQYSASRNALHQEGEQQGSRGHNVGVGSACVPQHGMQVHSCTHAVQGFRMRHTVAYALHGCLCVTADCHLPCPVVAAEVQLLEVGRAALGARVAGQLEAMAAARLAAGRAALDAEQRSAMAAARQVGPGAVVLTATGFSGYCSAR
jgi:hypothetical protein